MCATRLGGIRSSSVLLPFRRFRCGLFEGGGEGCNIVHADFVIRVYVLIFANVSTTTGLMGRLGAPHISRGNAGFHYINLAFDKQQTDHREEQLILSCKGNGPIVSSGSAVEGNSEHHYHFWTWLVPSG